MPEATEPRLTIDARKLKHSGIGRYIRNLLPGLLPQLNVARIDLLGNETDLQPYRDLDPRVSVVPSDAGPHSLAEQRLAWSPALRRTNLLWVPHYNVPLPYRGRLVVTIHDLAPIDLPEALQSTAKRAIARLWLGHAARRASAILTPSNFSRTRILEVLAPTAPVYTTPLAVDPDWPQLADAPPAHQQHSPYFLFVGNIKPNKNLTTLLSALQLLTDHPEVQLLIVGKQEGFHTADNLGRTLADSLGSRVSFVGAVNDSELISLYRGAAAFVMPSLYEGFGLPVLEAMRYGCPVIASATTSLPEVAGNAALLFDPRDPAALAEQLREVLLPETARRLRVEGRARESQFSYKEACKTTAEVLNRLISK